MSVCTSLFVLASFFFAISVITPTGGRGEEVGEATEVHVHASAGCWVTRSRRHPGVDGANDTAHLVNGAY